MPRNLVWAAALGSLLALALDLVLLLGPDLTLVEDVGLLGSFYDIQGRAFLDGRLAVDPGAVAIEGFRVDGRTYLYFGPVPALLRLPVLLISHGVDGRLTQLSMLTALVVLLAASAWLQWTVRRLLAEGAPAGRAEAPAVFLLQFAVGAGAIPLYLASRPVVYHEAELWGAAFTAAALAVTVDVIRAPGVARVLLAGLFTALAVNTRLSVGMGPVLALSVLGAGCAAGLISERWGGRFRLERVAALAPGGPAGRSGATLAALALAIAVPLALSAAVNLAKFDRPFGIPLELQVASQVDPQRRAALAANPDGLFGARFVPTTLVQALRPDAVGATRAFPFVGLPADRAHVFGDVRFDTIEPSLSAPTSMPLLCLLTCVGAAGLVRRRAWAPLGVLAASAGGFGVTLTIAYVTTRYLADLLPFLVLGAAVGVRVLLDHSSRPRGVLGALAALALAGVVINGSVGLVGQRLVQPDTTPAERAAFVRLQDDVDEALGRAPRGVLAGETLPAPAPGRPGDLFVVGRCAGLYTRGLDGRWLPIERTAATGQETFAVRFPARPSARPERLVAFGAGRRRLELVAAARRRGRVFSVRSAGRTLAAGPPIAGLSGATNVMTTSFDEYLGRSYLAVRVAGRSAVTAPTVHDPGAPPRAMTGRAISRASPTGGEPEHGLAWFSGRLRRLLPRAHTCREVARGTDR
jgi:hypothetical protein